MAVLNWSIIFLISFFRISIPASIKQKSTNSSAAIFSEFCGRRPSHRIVGGRNISPEIWPWLVTLRTVWGSIFCAGSLITNQYVLSAGHCFDPFLFQPFQDLLKVAPGIYERKVGIEFLLDITSYHLHHHFARGGRFYNDIALVKLKNKFESFIPVCLPPIIMPSINKDNDTQLSEEQNVEYETTVQLSPVISSQETNRDDDYSNADDEIQNNEIFFPSRNIFGKTDQIKNISKKFMGYFTELDPNIVNIANNEKEKYVILGWGRPKQFAPPSQNLQQAEINILNSSFCEEAYDKDFNPDIMICGGSSSGGVDACQGDSGGPLLKNDGHGTWYQVGIVSYGFGCGNAEFPGVYTDLSVYVGWIRDIISKDQ